MTVRSKTRVLPFSTNNKPLHKLVRRSAIKRKKSPIRSTTQHYMDNPDMKLVKSSSSLTTQKPQRNGIIFEISEFNDTPQIFSGTFQSPDETRRENISTGNRSSMFVYNEETTNITKTTIRSRPHRSILSSRFDQYRKPADIKVVKPLNIATITFDTSGNLKPNQSKTFDTDGLYKDKESIQHWMNASAPSNRTSARISAKSHPIKKNVYGKEKKTHSLPISPVKVMRNKKTDVMKPKALKSSYKTRLSPKSRVTKVNREHPNTRISHHKNVKNNKNNVSLEKKQVDKTNSTTRSRHRSVSTTSSSTSSGTSSSSSNSSSSSHHSSSKNRRKRQRSKRSKSSSSSSSSSSYSSHSSSSSNSTASSSSADSHKGKIIAKRSLIRTKPRAKPAKMSGKTKGHHKLNMGNKAKGGHVKMGTIKKHKRLAKTTTPINEYRNDMYDYSTTHRGKAIGNNLLKNQRLKPKNPSTVNSQKSAVSASRSSTRITRANRPASKVLSGYKNHEIGSFANDIYDYYDHPHSKSLKKAVVLGKSIGKKSNKNIKNTTGNKRKATRNVSTIRSTKVKKLATTKNPLTHHSSKKDEKPLDMLNHIADYYNKYVGPEEENGSNKEHSKEKFPKKSSSKHFTTIKTVKGSRAKTSKIAHRPRHIKSFKHNPGHALSVGKRSATPAKRAKTERGKPLDMLNHIADYYNEYIGPEEEKDGNAMHIKVKTPNKSKNSSTHSRALKPVKAGRIAKTSKISHRSHHINSSKHNPKNAQGVKKRRAPVKIGKTQEKEKPLDMLNHIADYYNEYIGPEEENSGKVKHGKVTPMKSKFSSNHPTTLISDKGRRSKRANISKTMHKSHRIKALKSNAVHNIKKRKANTISTKIGDKSEPLNMLNHIADYYDDYVKKDEESNFSHPKKLETRSVRVSKRHGPHKILQHEKSKVKKRVVKKLIPHKNQKNSSLKTNSPSTLKMLNSMADFYNDYVEADEKSNFTKGNSRKISKKGLKRVHSKLKKPVSYSNNKNKISNKRYKVIKSPPSVSNRKSVKTSVSNQNPKSTLNMLNNIADYYNDYVSSEEKTGFPSHKKEIKHGRNLKNRREGTRSQISLPKKYGHSSKHTTNVKRQTTTNSLKMLNDIANYYDEYVQPDDKSRSKTKEKRTVKTKKPSNMLKHSSHKLGVKRMVTSQKGETKRRSQRSKFSNIKSYKQKSVKRLQRRTKSNGRHKPIHASNEHSSTTKRKRVDKKPSRSQTRKLSTKKVNSQKTRARHHVKRNLTSSHSSKVKKTGNRIAIHGADFNDKPNRANKRVTASSKDTKMLSDIYDYYSDYVQPDNEKNSQKRSTRKTNLKQSPKKVLSKRSIKSNTKSVKNQSTLKKKRPLVKKHKVAKSYNLSGQSKRKLTSDKDTKLLNDIYNYYSDYVEPDIQHPKNISGTRKTMTTHKSGKENLSKSKSNLRKKATLAKAKNVSNRVSQIRQSTRSTKGKPGIMAKDSPFVKDIIKTAKKTAIKSAARKKTNAPLQSKQPKTSEDNRSSSWFQIPWPLSLTDSNKQPKRRSQRNEQQHSDTESNFSTKVWNFLGLPEHKEDSASSNLNKHSYENQKKQLSHKAGDKTNHSLQIAKSKPVNKKTIKPKGAKKVNHQQLEQQNDLKSYRIMQGKNRNNISSSPLSVSQGTGNNANLGSSTISWILHPFSSGVDPTSNTGETNSLKSNTSNSNNTSNFDGNKIVDRNNSNTDSRQNDHTPYVSDSFLQDTSNSRELESTLITTTGTLTTSRILSHA